MSAGLMDRPDQDLVHVDAGRLGESEHDRAGHVVGREGAFGAVVEERRVDHARLDDRRLDVAVGDLGAEGVAHRRDGPLGSRVERAGQSAPARDRARQQHVPAIAVLAPVGERGADRERGAEHVGVDHRLPELDRLLQEAALRAEARVGEKGVHAAEAVDGLLHQGLLVVPARHVAADGEGRVVPAELADQGRQLVLRAGRQHDAVVELDGALRGRRADAGAGTCDDEYLLVGHCVVVSGRMAATDPTQARFAAVARKSGHYESFYLKACHPAGGRGIWIRYTVHKRPGADPLGSVWFTLFDAGAGAPYAVEEPAPAPSSGGEDWLRVGEAAIGPGRAAGGASGEGRSASWELRFDTPEEPLFHLPRGWMYGAPVPRTKLLSPAPAATFSGRISAAGRELAVDGWRGMVGHNWGSQHAERWIWLHAVGFDGDPGAWLDVALGRVRIGPLTTPWLANGALHLDGRRMRLGGLRTRARVAERPDGGTIALGDVRIE